MKYDIEVNDLAEPEIGCVSESVIDEPQPPFYLSKQTKESKDNEIEKQKAS